MFSQPPPEIQEIPASEMNALRADMEVVVKGFDPPPMVFKFEQFGFDSTLVRLDPYATTPGC